ncbi:MAG: DNA repair protein RecO [Verrucomicrobiota bacterium]
MSTHKSEGLILHLRRYSETSLIAEWITRDHGMVHTLARGALRPKKKHAPLDLFQQGDLVYRVSRASSLHTMVEFHPSFYHQHIAKDYRLVLTLTYAYECMKAFTEMDTPLTELYDLITRFIAHCKTSPLEKKTIEQLEYRLFSTLGLFHDSIAYTRQHLPRDPHQFSSYQKLLRYL